MVAATDRPTQAMLAAEALKKAATALGHSLAVELRAGDAVTGALAPDAIAAAEAVLLVGDAKDDGRFKGKKAARVTLDAALADAAAALGGAVAPAAGGKKIVAITSCPTGIAHTFMAAEGIEQGGKALGHEVRVETQGSVGAQNTLTAAEIAAADLVIIAADTNVDMSRFGGKMVYSTGTKGAISNGKALVARAFAEAVRQGGGGRRPARPRRGSRRREGGPRGAALRPLQAPDDRRLLHAAVRGGRRSADRHRLRARRHLRLRRRPQGHARPGLVPDRRQERPSR